MRRFPVLCCVAAALVSAAPMYGQKSLVLNGETGSYTIPAMAPWTTLGNVRIDFRLHDVTLPAATAFLFSAGRLSVSMMPEQQLLIYNAEDSGSGGNSIYVPIPNRTDFTVRIQRNVLLKRVTVEVWDTDGGKNYAIVTQSYANIGTGTWAQTRSVGSSQARAKVAFIHMSHSIVDAGSPPPSEHTPGELIQWNFEGNLNDTTSGIQINLSNPQYSSSPLYGPVVLPRISGAAGWVDEPTVRAGQTVQLLGSASYSFSADPTLKYFWRTIDGPSEVIWSDRREANPKIQGLVFGEYRLRLTVADVAGQERSRDLVFGAVVTDDRGVVAPADPKIDLVFGPLIRFGASPWPWHDQNNREMADVYGSLVTAGNGVWAQDWNSVLSGTVRSIPGNRSIQGEGTSFQTDFCGGPGNTAPVGQYSVIVLRNGPARATALVSSCVSQTEIRVAPGEEQLLPDWTAIEYAKTLNGTWWGGAANGSGGSNNANYYDNVMAHYSLYYRTGLAKYREHARILADRWYDSPFFLRGFMPPRMWAMTGIMWRAYEGNRVGWWADKLHPHLDSVASALGSGTVGDTREQAFKVAAVAIGSALTSDETRAATYKQALIDAANNVWLPERTDKGAWITNTHFYAAWNGYPGTATVTNGSRIVTGVGTAWSETWPWGGGNCFWIADNSGSGDPVTYRATWNSPTQVTLDRPYEGPSASGKKWQLSNLCGTGTQPFMVGVASAAWAYAYQVTQHPAAKDLFVKASRWVVSEGMQTATKGLYYGRYYPNCEPINNLKPNCAYDPSSPGAVEASRFLSGEIFSGLAMAYLETRDATLLDKGDKLFGGNMGRLGGPESDSIYATLLQGSLSGAAPKNYGFFYGFGRASTWPAARAGGLALARSKRVEISTRLQDVPSSTQVRVKLTDSTGHVTEKVCSGSSCELSVDATKGAEMVVQLEYLNDSGRVLAKTEPAVLR